MAELNERLGRQWNCKVTLAVSVHVGRAVVGGVGASDPPTVIAIGEAVDAAPSTNGRTMTPHTRERAEMWTDQPYRSRKLRSVETWPIGRSGQ
jgi:hypothetical protein